MLEPNPEGCIAAERAGRAHELANDELRAEPANTPLVEQARHNLKSGETRRRRATMALMFWAGR